MKVLVEKLVSHPLNKEIYTLSDIDSLSESISQVGLLVPLTINQEFQVISGNRRLECIKRLGWKEVEVQKLNVQKEDEILLLIHYNKQRTKTIQEILHEYDYLKQYYFVKIRNGIKNTREAISREIKITDGQLARILFVRKHNPEMIGLIDKGILTVNQSYLQSQRIVKERKSIIGIVPERVDRSMSTNDFRFYLKSSENMVEIEDEEVQCIFSSPPYYRKRLYSENGGLGNEKTDYEYVQNLSEHLKDFYRVLNRRGSLFLVLGDTFIDGDLRNIPHRVIMNLQKQGWILRNTIIWAKTNSKPSSSKSNLCPTYEFIFHLTKSMDYYYEHTYFPNSSKTKPSLPPRHRSDKIMSSKNISPYLPNINGRNMGDFWTDDIVRTAVSNQKLVEGIEHPAPFPQDIVYLPILQTVVYPILKGLKVNPVVLDPFAGSLTVHKVCTKINQSLNVGIQFIGYDIKRFF